MNLRELMIEYICFAIDEQTMAREFGLQPDDLQDLADIDLLEMYDTVLLEPTE